MAGRSGWYEIRHERQAKEVDMRIQADETTHVSITVNFLIGPEAADPFTGEAFPKQQGELEVGT